MKIKANVTIAQLKRAIDVREKIESLETELAQILGGEVRALPGKAKTGRKKMSAAGRAKIAAAQKTRWAKVRGTTAKPKRKMSKAGRAKIAAAAKKRWAAVRVAGKTRL